MEGMGHGRNYLFLDPPVAVNELRKIFWDVMPGRNWCKAWKKFLSWKWECHSLVLDIMPKRIEWTALCLRIHSELGGGFSSWISET